MSAPERGDERELPAAVNADRRVHPVRRVFIDLLARLHAWAESGWAPHATFAWNTMQGSVVPGPSDALLVPLGIADPPVVFRLALWATLGATLGGVIGWLIGANAFEQLGRPILHMLGVDDGTILSSKGLFARRGWLIVMLATVTPLPTKLVCIASGAFGVPLAPFTLALAAGRGIRFTVIAAAVHFAGERLERWKSRLRSKRT